MWVNREMFDMIVADNKATTQALFDAEHWLRDLQGAHRAVREQKAKDDLTIDWMRHRVNALEKMNAILMQKATGIALPVPEIVPTRPGTIAGQGIDYDTMPSFEDVGDAEAKRLGIKHATDGSVEYSR